MEARSKNTVPTVSAVGFFVAILALAMSFYLLARSNQIVAGVLDVEAASLRANMRSDAENQAQIDALQARIAALEAQVQAQAQAAPPPAAAAP